MRFQRLTISGFGPFAGTETIDFERLAKAGLFLLAGPTGAGKTTLLDSICYALFGETTAEGQGKGAVDGRTGAELRSSRARADQLTEVSLEFVVGGRLYRVVRNPQYVRAKRGGGTTTEQANASLHRWQSAPDGTGGRYEPVAGKVRDVTERVEEITGFTADHFRRVVVIPQGRFRDVLVSTAEAREDLLKRIFGTEVYERFEETVATRARETAQQVATIAADRTRVLGGHDWATGLDDAAVAVRIGENLAAARSRAEATGRVLADVNARHDAAARQLGAAAELQRLVEGVAEAEKRLAAATAARDALADGRDALALATAAAEPARLRAVASERATEAAEAATALASQRSRRLAAEATVAAAVSRSATAQQDHNAVEEIDRRLGVIGSVLADASALRGRHADAAERLRAAGDAVTRARRDEAAANAAARRAEKERGAAEAACGDARRLHGANAAARLAAALASGTPCPVCGSHDHPRRATPIDGAPTDGEVERLEDGLVSAVRRRQAAATALAAAVEARVASEGQEKAARAVVAALAPLPAVGDLERERDGLQVRRAALETARRAAVAAVEAAERALREVAETLAAAEARCVDTAARAEEAACAFTAALTASPFATAEALAAAFREPGWIATLEARIAASDREAVMAAEMLADRRHQLGGRAAPDVAALQAAHDALVANRGAAVADDEEARHGVTTLERLAGDHAELAARCALAGREADTAHALHRMVSGTAHAQDRLSLHRWVLAAVLEQVVAHATVLLRQMTRGRYELVRAESAARNVLAGLEIDVFDHWTGTRRGARTLSGGETFLASLALSLALARAAEEHQGGRRLETVFIDEGFGSLDADTLEYALVALQGLRAEGRVVGVISHVEEMQRSIPAQLRLVRRGEVTTTEIVGVP
ncbi:MAG: AAA family ATPase [Planctomycetaceae bacterium]